MSKQDGRIRFLAKLPPDLHRRLKVAAAEQGTDMNALLIMALNRALNPETVAEAVFAALQQAWVDDEADAKVIEIYVSKIAPIVERILAEGSTS